MSSCQVCTVICASWSFVNEVLPWHPRRRNLRVAVCARDLMIIAMAVCCRAASSPPEERKTQSRQKLPLLPTSPEGAHTRPPIQGVLAGRQDKAAGPTRSWSMPSTRGFPAQAHPRATPRATPQTGRSGFRAASRDDVLPLIRPKLVCACLPFSPDHVPLPRERVGGGGSVIMSLRPSWASTCACAAHRD